MRAVEAGGLSDLAVAKKIGHEAFLHPVQDEIEGVVAARRRSNGVCAGDEPLSARLAYGDKLSGQKIERRDLLDVEFEVFRFLRKKHGADKPGGKQVAFHVRP